MSEFRREHINLLAPPSGRRDTLVGALEELHGLTDGQGAHIVEVGTTRNSTELACLTDGWATRIFAWYAAQTGGRVTTIDTNPRAAREARKVCHRWWDSISCVTGHAERVLAKLDESIDLLYMDGPSDALVHRDAFWALRGRPTLVLWDDTVGEEPAKHWPKWPPEGMTDPYAVKGTLAIPDMLQEGYRIEWMRGRQLLMSWAG